MKESKIKNQNKERVRKAISRVFEIEKNGIKRIKIIASKLKPFLDSRFVDKEKIYQSLKSCSSIENKKKFTNRVLNIIQPFFHLRSKDREEIKREIFLREGNFEPLNDILSYSEHFQDNEKVIHIHLAPSRELKKEKGELIFFQLIQDGLIRLANLVEKDKEVRKIIAASWIIGKRPNFIERFGFKIDGEISKDFRKKYFPYEEDDDKIIMAHINRGEFLKKFLK